MMSKNYSGDFIGSIEFKNEREIMNIFIKLRNWLIVRLAGKSPIILNADLSNKELALDLRGAKNALTSNVKT